MAKIRADVQSLHFGTLGFLKVCVAKIRTDVQSLYFGTLGFLKVCVAKICTDVQSLDFGKFELQRFVWRKSARMYKV